jgi:glycosyltransferase involved in cell wall biosynthesis
MKQTTHNCKVTAKRQNPQDVLDRIVENRLFKMKLNETRLLKNYMQRQQKVIVSVIMPTYNRAFIIGRAIESILAQRYKNVELFIIDDGSVDNTESVISKYRAKDDRITYLRCHHSGVSFARNLALKMSNGELIAYLDSDNVWSPNYLLLMVNTFEDHPNIGTLYCGIRVVDNIHNRKYIRLTRHDRNRLMNQNYIDLNVFMHKREVYETFGGFDESLTSLEDWELIIRYTDTHPPHVLEACLVTYFLEKRFNHLSLQPGLIENYGTIRRRWGND